MLQIASLSYSAMLVLIPLPLLIISSETSSSVFWLDISLLENFWNDSLSRRFDAPEQGDKKKARPTLTMTLVRSSSAFMCLAAGS